MSGARRSLSCVALAFAVGCSDDAAKPPPANDGSVIGPAVEGICETEGLGIDGGASDGGGSTVPLASSGAVDYLHHIGCGKDFQALASDPIDSTLPGARSAKVVYDTAQADGVLYFQNSVLYPIHFDFASTHLSGNGLPVVQKASFDQTEYYSAGRRFILGAVTYYEGAGVWALELSPYDTASATMIATLFYAVRDAAFFGPALTFHPTSDAITTTTKKLSADIPRVTTDQLYAKIDFQPLNVARAVGKLTFTTAEALDQGQYLSYQSIVVLDEVPNDISVVSGIITQEFQTPLSHLNVLSRNRKTPNMGLRNALTNEILLAHKDQLVELTVTALSWKIRSATEEEGQAYWASQKPEAKVLPPIDLEPRELLDVEDIAVESSGETLRATLKAATNAWGGKTAQYAILAKTDGVPVKKAFGIPCYYYYVFMRDNGLFNMVDGFLADPVFVSDMAVRYEKLAELRAAMLEAPLDPALESKLAAKLAADYPGQKMRFRTSTNSEDLEGFPCAGCYESHTGDPSDWESVRDAIRLAFASTWLFRTFEERSYYSVDHQTVVMALLVHEYFADEEANGVAITANIYDRSGLDPAYYINVQYGGDAEVVHPPKGVQSDQILYYFSSPNQPTTYLAHSNLIPVGTTVLTKYQLYTLGTALAAIHDRFSAAYGPAIGNQGWYAMDVEFKFDNQAAPAELATLYIKQARPYPDPGGSN
jgi:hypothetical protein